MRERIGSKLMVQKGFTLIELLAVMAIIGILAGILVPTVSSTGETGRDTQAKQDATIIESSSGEYFSDKQNAAEILTPETATTTATTNSDTVASATQTTSSRWPEKFLTVEFGGSTATTSASYLTELSTAGSGTDGVVVNMILKDSDGTAISRADLFGKYTAIDLSALETGGFITDTPESVTNVSTVSGNDYHSLLWTFRKQSSSAGSGGDDARKVVVFKLTSVRVIESTSTVELAYEQVF